MDTFSLRLLIFSGIVLLTGCYDDTSDLKAYIESVKTTTTTDIEPMPVVEEFFHIKYSADQLRSPFVLPQAEVIQLKIQQISGCLSPDASRRKQPLEKYALSDLSMRGTMGDAEQLWALIQASDSSLHRVSSGHYLGLYHGRITEVNDDSVKLKELSPDGSGCWVEREAELKIVKSEFNK